MKLNNIEAQASHISQQIRDINYNNIIKDRGQK